MADDSKIEWTDATWNPVRGCTKISPGCKFCYAEVFAERFRGVPGHAYELGFDVRTVPGSLEIPLRWKRPRRIFVNSMSDLFHKDIPDEYIRQVFDVMERASHHTYQVLTKRSDRLATLAPSLPWPRNIWAGVSVERQDYVTRAWDLLEVPAAVRFLSCEPLLGALDLHEVLGDESDDIADGPFHRASMEGPSAFDRARGIQWVIVGGESGNGARPMQLDWAQSIVDQCKASGVPVFVKQLGRELAKERGLVHPKGGDMAEFPFNLQERQFPEVA
jgi:protein gp37